MSLFGTWKLVSCSGVSQSGKAFQPYGSAPAGHIVYTSEGKMAVVLMDSSRASFRSDNLSEVSAQEKVAAFDSFDAYSGSFVLDEGAGIVTHKIEAGRVPNWVGEDHIRYFSISKDTLTIKTAPFQMADEEWTVEVVWQRVGSVNR